MTIKELRMRLKHIAGLLYTVTLDLRLHLEDNERLKAENAELKNYLLGAQQEVHRLEANLRATRNRYKRLERDPDRERQREHEANLRAREKRAMKKSSSEIITQEDKK